MDEVCVIFTVVIRGPAYRELIAQLSAVADPRNRAGLLKRLAEDGTQVSGSPFDVMTGHTAPVNESGSATRGFDIRLVIRREEFPLLHERLLQCGSPRARAAQFRQLAHEGARRRQVMVAPRVPTQHAVHNKADPREAKTKSISGLALEPGSIPKNLFSGFGPD